MSAKVGSTPGPDPDRERPRASGESRGPIQARRALRAFLHQEARHEVGEEEEGLGPGQDLPRAPPPAGAEGDETVGDNAEMALRLEGMRVRPDGRVGVHGVDVGQNRSPGRDGMVADGDLLGRQSGGSYRNNGPKPPGLGDNSLREGCLLLIGQCNLSPGGHGGQLRRHLLLDLRVEHHEGDKILQSLAGGFRAAGEEVEGAGDKLLGAEGGAA